MLPLILDNTSEVTAVEEWVEDWFVLQGCPEAWMPEFKRAMDGLEASPARQTSPPPSRIHKHLTERAL